MKKYKLEDKGNLHKQVQNFFGTYEPIADFEMIKIGYNIVKALKIDKNKQSSEIWKQEISIEKH